MDSIIENFSDIMIPELPKLVDNVNFDFLHWDVWLEPVQRMSVYVTDPLGSSIRAFIWFLVMFSQKELLNRIERPQSLEIREKSFLESLRSISSKKELNKKIVQKVENKIKNWASEAKRDFWNRIEGKDIDKDRENEIKIQIRNGFDRILFPKEILQQIIEDKPNLEYKKMDVIINVPRTLVVKKASEFTEFGIFGAGGPIGESVARGINKYILDQIKTEKPGTISYNTIIRRLEEGEKLICSIHLWRKLVTDYTLNKIPVAKSINDLSLDNFKEVLIPERDLDLKEVILIPDRLGLLIKKSELEISLYKENERDLKTGEPMVLFRIKIIFCFKRNIELGFFKLEEDIDI